VFWAFKPCIDAFRHLKPMIQIDGTFLYGKYSHKLLIATGQDGNLKVVPLAFAIVEEEKRESWSFFLTMLRRHVVKERQVCMISDRHGGILSAVANDESWQPPLGYHVFCIRHLASNLNTAHHDRKAKKMFTSAGKFGYRHFQLLSDYLLFIR